MVPPRRIRPRHWVMIVVMLLVSAFRWAPPLHKFTRSNSDGVMPRLSSSLYDYDLPPTLATCNVSKLFFDVSRMNIREAPMMFVPNHTEKVAYGPWLPKCGSTTIVEMLRDVGNDRNGIRINSAAMENDYTFVSFLRHPLERALSAFSQIEIFYHMGWFNGHIEKFNLTWWNTSCINTTWGVADARPLCTGSVPSRSIPARLKRLNALLYDLEINGYPDWHVVPVTYLMSTSRVVQKARRVLFFDMKNTYKVQKALNKAFNVTHKLSAMNVKPRSNPDDPHGMHWHVRWTELVKWADTMPLAQGVIDKLCSLYRHDVECLPFEVPECNYREQ